MKPFPHHYHLEAHCSPEGPVSLNSDGVAELTSDAPIEFDGPGGLWSPESLLVAAVADCFSLSFRAMAKASKLDWNELRCSADGTLDRVDGTMRFSQIDLRATLIVPAGARLDRAQRLLERAEKSCPITNSLSTPVRLEAEVREV